MTEYKLEDIERIKENFVPLQRGHKASVLSGLSSSSADQKQRIQSTRVQFEREIADLSDDHLDPLDVFYRFVKFVQEFMPADSSTLKKLLEKAVRKFRADERYKNDARNLHLWMLVAKGAPDPREVFKYLSVHDIAQSFSLFYEEYASFLESRGEFEEADEVLLLGVHRKAQPLERLIRKQLEFRQRQKNREKSLLIDSPMSNAAVFSNDLSSAQVLRTLSSSNPQLQSSSQSIKPPSVAASSSSKSFKVHKDENSTGMSVRPSVQELLPNNEGRSSEGAELFWKDYGSDAGRQKENIKEATGWIGQKLHQKSKLIPQKNFDKFEVFKDGQADEPTEQARGGSSKSSANSTKQRITKPVVPPSAITGTRIAVDDTILLTNNTPNEMTFEEFRANAFEKYRMLAFMTAGELEAREMAEEVAAVATQQQQNPPSSYNGNISGDIVDSDDEEVVSRPVQQSDKKKRIAVSPTINTKAALADVYEMFSQPLSCEQYDEEDETISSKVYKPMAASFSLGVFQDDVTSKTIPSVAAEFQRPTAGLQASVPGKLKVFPDENEAPNPTSSSSTSSHFKVFSENDENSRLQSISTSSLNPSSSALAAVTSEKLSIYHDDSESEYEEPVSIPVTMPSSSTYRLPRNFQMMTPIAEVSRDGSMLSSFSTIKSSRSGNSSNYEDSDLIDKTVLTLSDRTFGSIMASSASASDHSLILLPDQHGGADVAPSTHVNNRSSSCTGVNNTSHTSLSNILQNIQLEETIQEEEESVFTSDNLQQAAPTSDLRMAYEAEDEMEVGQEEKVENGEEEEEEEEEKVNIMSMELNVANPCNPYETALTQRILAAASQMLHRPKELIFCVGQSVGMINKFENAANEGKKTSTQKFGSYNSYEDDEDEYEIELPEFGSIAFIRKLGEGGFGKVYLVRDCTNSNTYGGDEEDGDEFTEHINYDAVTHNAISKCAVKLQSPPALWEFYILSQLFHRMSPRLTDSIIQPLSCHLFKDESCLRLLYGDQGSLLDCVNSTQKSTIGINNASTQGLHESLAVFWAIELLRTIEGVHGAGIIHGDVKIDNVLVRLKEHSPSTFSKRLEEEVWESYQEDGTSGWKNKGLMLIDWGTAVDLNAFSDEQRFIKSEQQRALGSKQDVSIHCWEVRNSAPWKYQVDWYGVAGVLHVLLFGTYMAIQEETVAMFDEAETRSCGSRTTNTERCSGNTSDILTSLYRRSGVASAVAASKQRPYLRPVSAFKRYWPPQLRELFDVLLNADVYNSIILESASDPDVEKCICESISAIHPSEIGPGTNLVRLHQEFPLIVEIRRIRLDLAVWLQSSSSKGLFRNMIVKIQKTFTDRF